MKSLNQLFCCGVLDLVHRRAHLMSRNALNEAPVGRIGDRPDDGLSGDVGSDIADHCEKVVRERSERGS